MAGNVDMIVVAPTRQDPIPGQGRQKDPGDKQAKKASRLTRGGHYPRPASRSWPTVIISRAGHLGTKVTKF